MSDTVKAVIMAGGKGTRIASVAADVPKPLIPVGGKPILEHQIGCLRSQGFTDITLVIGHLGAQIEEHFDDGSSFGVRISYFRETTPLGTAGALFPLLTDGGLGDGEDFLLINGDLIFDVDFHRFLAFHREHKALASLAAHPNSHPYDSTLLVCDENAKVTAWLSKEDPERGRPGRYFMNLVNAGLHILSKQLLSHVTPTADKVDLDRGILRPQIAREGIFAYHTPEYIKDMGTPERYRQVAADLEGGLVAAKNLGRKQRAVFLDRDGTVNKSAGFINKAEQLVLCDGAAAAIRRINDAGYLAIIVTNQPVIARGDVTLDDLARIHAKLETDLGQKGAYVDDIFFCPHHPDKGFPGERPEYKIPCECRKPKPGLLLLATEKYHIDPAASWMVGDDGKDAAAGRAAGCKTALIGDGDGAYKSLAEFVNANF